MARMRSPNFPQLTLKECLGIAGDLYGKIRKVTVDREAAAKELGYSGLTGRSLKVLGALNQFGLIDNLKGGQCRVTDLAEQALHGYPEEEKLEAIHTAAHSPKLFGAIFDEFGEGIESEHAIRSFLLKRGFTDKGVESALESFLETQRFLDEHGNLQKAEPASSNEGDDFIEASAEDSNHLSRQSDHEQVAADQQQEAPFVSKHNSLDFSLTSQGLAISGRTNSRKELSEFVDKLRALGTLLPDDEDEN